MFKKLSAHDIGRGFSPVYVPDETYSFVINGNPITDPDFDFFILRLEDADGNVIANDIGELKKVLIENVSYDDDIPVPYWIYCIFNFPNVPLGNYTLVIYDTEHDIVKCRSNAIQCEQQFFENTMRVEYAHYASRSGYPYDQLIRDGVQFLNMFRLPVSQISIQFESDKKQYRNATNQQFRNLRSYLDHGYKLQWINLDQIALKAVGELIECETVLFDNEQLTAKTQITEEPLSNSVLSNATFETYINQTPFEVDDIRVFGNKIIYCGDPGYSPNLVYNLNEP